MPTATSTGCRRPACASSPSTAPGGGPTWRRCSSPRAIAEGRPIRLFNEGRHSRDFTYVGDIAEGVIRASDRPALPDPDWDPADPDPATSDAPFRLYNIGNGAPVELADFIAALEAALGKKAVRELLPLQPGDVPDTWADSSRLARAVNWRPDTPVEEGVRRFVAWFRDLGARAKHRMAAETPAAQWGRGMFLRPPAVSCIPWAFGNIQLARADTECGAEFDRPGQEAVPVPVPGPAPAGLYPQGAGERALRQPSSTPPTTRGCAGSSAASRSGTT